EHHRDGSAFPGKRHERHLLEVPIRTASGRTIALLSARVGIGEREPPVGTRSSDYSAEPSVLLRRRRIWRQARSVGGSAKGGRDGRKRAPRLVPSCILLAGGFSRLSCFEFRIDSVI